VKDTFFGGAEKKGAKAEQRAAEAGAKLTAEQLAVTEGQVSPFISQGATPSLEAQQALSGALGPDAQAEAFANFQEDPGTEFLREQGLRLVNTGAAVTGNVGGGERLRELTKFSQGLALQDLSSRFNRLGVTAGGEEDVIRRQQDAACGLGGLRAGSIAQQAGSLLQAGQAKSRGITGAAAGLRAGIQQGAAGFVGGQTAGLTGAVQGGFGV